MPASSLGSISREWPSTSSQTESTIYVCPCWRVVQLPTGSSGYLCAVVGSRAAGMAKRARALPLLPFSHSSSPVLLLHTGTARSELVMAGAS